jgi:hypothetical protein
MKKTRGQKSRAAVPLMAMIFMLSVLDLVVVMSLIFAVPIIALMFLLSIMTMMA